MPPVFGYRPSTNRNVIRSGYPVCVIATFNPAGDFKPVSFGVEFDGFRYRYKIKSAFVVKDDEGEITFECVYVDLGRVKVMRLVFNVIECRWVVG